MKSLNLRVTPIANMMKPREKLYEAGPAFTNHAKAEGFRQATIPPTVTYRGYKLAAVISTFSHLGFSEKCSDLPFRALITLVLGQVTSFGGEKLEGLLILRRETLGWDFGGGEDEAEVKGVKLRRLRDMDMVGRSSINYSVSNVATSKQPGPSKIQRGFPCFSGSECRRIMNQWRFDACWLSPKRDTQVHGNLADFSHSLCQLAYHFI